MTTAQPLPDSAPTRVSSWNDFDRLRHVIVGRADHTCIPPSEPATEAKIPDGFLDKDTLILRPDWGLLIFPHRTPFASDTTFVDGNGNRTQELLEKTPGIYSYSTISEKLAANLYYLEVRYLVPD